MVNPQLPPTAPMSGSTAACPRAVATNEPLGSDTQQLFLAAVPKKTEQRRWVVVGAQNLDAQNGTLWLFNIAMEAMAHRNRWFTY